MAVAIWSTIIINGIVAFMFLWCVSSPIRCCLAELTVPLCAVALSRHSGLFWLHTGFGW